MLSSQGCNVFTTSEDIKGKEFGIHHSIQFSSVQVYLYGANSQQQSDHGALYYKVKTL